jgi:hypothetical protein
MAVPLTTITGKLLTPDGQPVTKGTVSARLSQPGSVLDGTDSQRVAETAKAAIGTDGAISLALVPNDAITPSGTHYVVTIDAKIGARGRQWTEKWQITGTAPLDIGEVPRLGVVPGIAVTTAAAVSASVVAAAESARDGAVAAETAAEGYATTAGGVASRVTDLETHVSGWVNVKSFGAKGDGVTDDTAAFATANASSAPKLVPPGTYPITSANVTLDGVWVFVAGAALRPSPGRTVTVSATALVYAAAAWLDLSAGGSKTYTAGASKQAIVIGKASHIANVINGFVGNAVASDVGTSSVLSGGNAGSENLIGYREYLDRITGDGVTTTWVTTFDATPSQILLSLIRSDGVRVTSIASNAVITQAGSKVQVVYPQPGHFVNDGAGGAEGTNPALLATQKLYISSSVKAENPGSLSDYSSILDGYDNVIQQGVRQTASGAHQRITGGDHNTIFGGSYNRITSGSYGGIFGGSSNEIACTGSGAVIAGFGNTVSGTGPGIALGSTNAVSGVFATAIGNGNTAGGNGATALGRLNTASGQDTLVAGQSNTASAPYSSAHGLSNIASGTGYSSASGRSNVVSGGYSSATGYSNTAGADYTRVAGKNANATFPFSDVLGGEQFAALGDAQTRVSVVRRQTIDGTPTELRLGVATARLTIPTGTTWTFVVYVTARRTASTESASFKIEGALANDAGTARLVGTPTVTVIGRDVAAAAWTVAASADNTNDALSIAVTGEAGKTINWVGRVTLVEVSG